MENAVWGVLNALGLSDAGELGKRCTGSKIDQLYQFFGGETPACKRLFSLGCVGHTDGAVLQPGGPSRKSERRGGRTCSG